MGRNKFQYRLLWTLTGFTAIIPSRCLSPLLKALSEVSESWSLFTWPSNLCQSTSTWPSHIIQISSTLTNVPCNISQCSAVALAHPFFSLPFPANIHWYPNPSTCSPVSPLISLYNLCVWSPCDRPKGVSLETQHFKKQQVDVIHMGSGWEGKSNTRFTKSPQYIHVMMCIHYTMLSIVKLPYIKLYLWIIKSSYTWNREV